MGVGRKSYLDEYYKSTMTKEDYKLLVESFDNGAPMARPFSEFPYQKFNFSSEILTGKSISTYVSEIKGQLEAAAENFENKLAAYREDSGLSGKN